MAIEHRPLGSSNTPDLSHGTGPTSWADALARARGHTPRGDAGDAPPSEAPPITSRRSFLHMGFWGGVGLALLGGVGAFLDYLYPRNVSGFGGPVPAGKVDDYVLGGDPVMVREAQAWLVRLDPEDTRLGGSAGGEGLLALWRKCPHLGCTIPWEPKFSFEGDSDGWFRCPCHGSTYTKAGVRVWGPAKRSMDTMLVEVAADGSVTIQSGVISNGGPDNPSRALRV